MQVGMNANKREDLLAGKTALFFLSCTAWFTGLVWISWMILKKKDVKA